jgi:hypothetical protein
MEYIQGHYQKCAESNGFTPRYGTGLVSGERERVGSKITLSIDVTKIVGRYVIEVELVKTGFTVRDWVSVLENNAMYCKLTKLDDQI